MTTKTNTSAGEAPDPRTVSRGYKLQIGFLGIDSLYLVIEYPHTDVFETWSSHIKDFNDPKLYEGIPYYDLVIRRGGLGYKLSVWDGDARLFFTDRVNDTLEGTPQEGQGMGVMLQLGPQWLRKYGEVDGVFAPNLLRDAVEVQCAIFALPNPYDYPIRLNRLDLTIDLLGLDVADIPFDVWKKQWVGYAVPNNLYWDTKTGDNQGFAVGTSHGSVRFKVYDKVTEARKNAKYGFWRSVWGLSDEDEEVPVARLEWTVKCYQGRFVKIRYFEDLTYETFMSLLNYVTLKWGSMRIEQPNDQTKTRWPLTPFWADLVQHISEWYFDYDQIAKRDYRFEPDISEPYLRYVTGALSGLLTRVGFELGEEGPVSVAKGLSYMHHEGHTMAHIEDKATKKWRVFASLNRRGEQ